MDSINYTPRWQSHLATNEAPECPLYAEEAAIAQRIEEARANPDIALQRTLAQHARLLRERAS